MGPALLTKLMAVGLPAGLYNALVDVADNLTAIGSTQVTAYESSTAILRFTTVAAGTGVLLDNGSRGDTQLIVNDGANTLAVYPPVGNAIGTASTNAAYSLAAGEVGFFLRATSTLWIVPNANQSFSPASGTEEFWPTTSPPTSIRQALDYLSRKIGAYDYNLLDPKWGIIQKLLNGTTSVSVEIQAVLDYAAARRNVTTDVVNKAKVYAPGATYPLGATIYLPSWVQFEAEHANYEFFGACFWGLSGFNNGAGGDLVRVKSSVDPTSGAAFWGGGFVGFNMRGAPDGSVQYGFNTVNETGNNVELQDTAQLDFLSGRYLASGMVRLYGGVPNYIRRFRPYCCNGPGITLVGNVGAHNVTHIAELSGDQCNGGLLRLENWADEDVVVVTALKSERAASTHAFNHATTDSFYTTVAGWKNAGHDGQKHAISFNNCTGGKVVVNGGHHISAWNAKQITTFVGDTFTMPTNHEMVDGTPLQFSLVAGGALPTGISAATDYYAKKLTNTTFKIAANLGDVPAGPYISPTGGSAIYGDPGYLTAGDFFKVVAGECPAIKWDGVHIRYRPYASGGVERIGTEPNLISSLPIGDSTGGARTETVARTRSYGIITNEVPYFVLTTGGSVAARPAQFLVGRSSHETSDLNEDAVIEVAGTLPVFSLYDADSAVGTKLTFIRSNGGGMLFTAVNETDGTFGDWFRFNKTGAGLADFIDVYEDLKFPAAVNLQLDTVTGTKIGIAVTQKLGFWNTTPVVQPASANQAAVSAPASFVNTDGAIGGLSIGAAYVQAEVQALRDACEVLADDCRALRDKVATYETLITAMRTASVNSGLIKGSA